ncbi:hypothetical protein Nepgr_006759 [Nepenthes gracilis]|uniref:Uncharacterized protein n=1 Tax=Nepenthes gracilis TaxID=150966 RepID=A0AAD3XHN5_NEPGR|nr:hypothetical protein Nepgr_006759 [Nepenthes gracilis]
MDNMEQSRQRQRNWSVFNQQTTNSTPQQQQTEFGHNIHQLPLYGSTHHQQHTPNQQRDSTRKEHLHQQPSEKHPQERSSINNQEHKADCLTKQPSVYQ